MTHFVEANNTGPQKKVVCAGVLTISIPCILSR